MFFFNGAENNIKLCKDNNMSFVNFLFYLFPTIDYEIGI